MSTTYVSTDAIERYPDSRPGPDVEAMNIIDGSQPVLRDDSFAGVVRLAIALAEMPPRLRRAALQVVADPRAPRAMIARQAGVSDRTLYRAIQRLLSVATDPPAIGSSTGSADLGHLRRGAGDGVTYAGKAKKNRKKASKTGKNETATHGAEGSQA